MSDLLMATCWTTAGEAAPDRADRRSPVPLRDRVEAAAAAGFRGFGLNSVDLPEAERTYGMPGIKSIFDDNGITHIELEAVPEWWSGSAAGTESHELRRTVLRAAEVLHARHIKVTPDDSGLPWDFGRWASEFGRLATQAADSGARLGIEFLPWANISNPEEALHLVEEAGHDGGGVVVDVWHTERGSTAPAELAKLPLERIVGVELNDADSAVVGTLFEDTVHRRRYCGEGRFRLVDIVDALSRAGWSGPWGIEILSDDHRALPVPAAARKAFETGARVLERGLRPV
ncbi:MAG: sugar phosphate isomerase/epimerase [Pseudonocardia sp.]|nr:sugar phosphate isomerase/epimerase [Pseudonocardia sp.]